jgi:hypothetical protein
LPCPDIHKLAGATKIAYNTARHHTGTIAPAQREICIVGSTLAVDLAAAAVNLPAPAVNLPSAVNLAVAAVNLPSAVDLAPAAVNLPSAVDLSAAAVDLAGGSCRPDITL